MTTEVAVHEPNQQQRVEEAGQRMLALTDALEAAGLTLTDLLLSLDTQGFERVGASFNSQLDMQAPTRAALVRRSRLYWQMEPLPDTEIAVWTDYGFGREWGIQAKDAGFQSIIDSLLKSRANRKQFSRKAMRRASTSLLVDGERWFAFFVGPADIRVRNFDTLEIEDILKNPDDRDEVWYYRRTWFDGNHQQHTRFYRDWDFVDESGNPRNDPHPRMNANNAALQGLQDVKTTPEDDVWLTYLDINTLGDRGYPLLTSSLDWIRAHREFMRDRSSLSAARAQFAWKGAVKGGQGAVDALKSVFEAPDPLDISQGLRKPRAGVFIGNEGVDVSQFQGASDGASADLDAHAFRIMALGAGRIPEHLLGDISRGNLATAKAVDRPLETMFTAYQGDWIEFFQEMFYHLALWRGFAGDTTVDIDPPSILESDTAGIVTSLTALAGVYPVIAESRELLSMLLTDLGLNNVDDVMATLEPLWDAAAQQQAELAQAAAQAGPPTNSTKEALDLLREVAQRRLAKL